MYSYYDLDVLPIILNKFKVNHIVMCGMVDKVTMDSILEYCNLYGAEFVEVDSGVNVDKEVVNDSNLNLLSKLSNYDAIFLNDDPNWYTLFNELRIIKENNNEFPLVFICHNVFPHKRRDSYKDPNSIPEEFRHEYSKELNYKGFNIQDGFYHAIEKNTSNNGVLTAIEDFLDENSSISVMDIKLLNGITILYPENNISKVRLESLSEEIHGHDLKFDDLSDNIVENQILTNYLSKLQMSNGNIDGMDNILVELDEKRKIIDDYEYKMKLHDNEISYKNSQIETADSKLSSKDAQIKSMESKLINSENKIENLNNKLKNANDEIDSLKTEVNKKEQDFKNKEGEFDTKINNANSQILSLKTDLSQKEQRELELNTQLHDANNHLADKDYQIRNKQNEINNKDAMLNSIKEKYIKQSSELDNNEYCISCYKDEIANNQLEIEYLKNDSLSKKLLSPLAYVYLIFKSKPKELFLNFKLYRALKNSKCFDIGFYLNNNKDIQKSKWCKYFSPELHYVCNGLDEGRNFNKKYFNTNSKKELLEHIKICN